MRETDRKSREIKTAKLEKLNRDEIYDFLRLKLHTFTSDPLRFEALNAMLLIWRDVLMKEIEQIRQGR